MLFLTTPACERDKATHYHTMATCQHNTARCFRDDLQKLLQPLKHDFENELLKRAVQILENPPFRFAPRLISKAAEDIIVNHKHIFDAMEECDVHDTSNANFKLLIKKLYNLSDVYANLLSAQFVWIKMPSSLYSSINRSTKGTVDADLVQFLAFKNMLDLFECNMEDLRPFTPYTYTLFIHHIEKCLADCAALQLVIILNCTISKEFMQFPDDSSTTLEDLCREISKRFTGNLLLPKQVILVFVDKGHAGGSEVCVETCVISIEGCSPMTVITEGPDLTMRYGDLPVALQQDFIWWKNPEPTLQAAARPHKYAFNRDEPEQPGLDYVDSRGNNF